MTPPANDHGVRSNKPQPAEDAGQDSRPVLVVSGVNLVEAGPLAVFKDALHELSTHFAHRFRIVALVHRRDLFDLDGIDYLEFPQVKTSWLRRMAFEYIGCRKLSRQLQADTWLAMHDMTPSVTARVRAVYCHNPSPFYRLPLQEAYLDPRFTLFWLLYRFLYRIGIQHNDYVIVQQQWLRQEFQRRYPVRQVIVSHPSLPPVVAVKRPQTHTERDTIFFYPTLSRCFKNLELLLRAAALLERQGIRHFQVWLTIHGNENRYAAWLYRQFHTLSTVRWLGRQPRAEVERLYNEADCLVFPSRLETWGMPLTEFKRTGKQILAADLPYAHEAVGTYDHVHFISPTDPQPLAQAMAALIGGSLAAAGATAAPIPQPFAANWHSLFNLLLGTAAAAQQKPGSLA